MELGVSLKEVIKNGFSDIEKLLKGAESWEVGKQDIMTSAKCLILAMSEVERYLYINVDYYTKFVDNRIEPGKNYVDVDSRIKFDYQVSSYADKCYIADEKIMQKIASFKEPNKDLVEIFEFLHTFSKKMLQISARWHIQRQIEAMEYEKGYRSKKIPKRLPLLWEAMFFCDRMNATKMGIKFADGIMPKKIIFAVQPNSGKSFVANVFCNIGLILHKLYFQSSGIIRMTNTGTNAEGFSGQCKNMLSSKIMANIYPELTKYYKENGKTTIFKKEPLDEWLLADLDSSIRASMFARGRESSINGLRNDVALVIDDLSDGFEQMNNDQAHKDMVSKYDVDMDSRKEDENVPELIIGTMFNEFDLQNTLIDREVQNHGQLIQIVDRAGKILFPNSYVNKEKTFVVVRVDCFNENYESIAPKLISTERLREKQSNMAAYQFDLVYRQMKTSREPRMFDYNVLETYSEKGMKAFLSDTSVCVCDPTRKRSSDFFVLNCYRYNNNTKRYRLMDCICEQQSLGKISDPKNIFANKVIDFLIRNNCTKLIIENNVSNLIGSLVDTKLKNRNYNFCKIDEIYNTEQKGVRILNMETTIKNNIEFPEKNLFPTKHPMTIQMELITRFDANNIGKKGNYDDPVDNLAIMAKEHIYAQSKIATITHGDLPYFMR